MTRRLPVVALGVFVVGLALHNLAMATLWEWGVRGNGLDVVAAWKEALLAVALGAAVWHARRLPAPRRRPACCRLRGIVILYALIPQGWLDGARPRVESCSRCGTTGPWSPPTRSAACSSSRPATCWLLWLAASTGAALALWGLADAYLVPLQWWRDSGSAGWYREQLGLDYKGLSGLPGELGLQHRRRVGPAAALRLHLPQSARPVVRAGGRAVAPAARRPTRWTMAAAAACYAACSDAHSCGASRAVVRARRPGGPATSLVARRGAAASLVVAFVFVKAYPTIGPRRRTRRPSSRISASTRGSRAARRATRSRLGVVRLEPLAQPPRRRRDGAAPPAGLRPRHTRA